MSAANFFKWFPIAALFPLALFVLFTPYDPLVNRAAVAITLIATSIGFLGFDRLLRRRTGAGLSALSAWVVGFAAAEDAFGNFMFWYEAWDGYDDLGHAVGTLAVTIVFLDLLPKFSQKRQWQLSRMHLAIQSVAFAMLFAVVYEISELFGDVFLGTYRVTARLDSSMDLFWGLLGSVIVAAIWLRWGRTSSSPDH